MIGIDDRFGESGQPWELMKLFNLTAEFIAEKAIVLLKEVFYKPGFTEGVRTQES